jgi:hypothetical protein
MQTYIKNEKFCVSLHDNLQRSALKANLEVGNERDEEQIQVVSRHNDSVAIVMLCIATSPSRCISPR